MSGGTAAASIQQSRKGKESMKANISILILGTVLMIGCVTPRPWTKGEKAMLFTSCLATAVDTYTTIEGLNNGCSELNAFIGKDPSNMTVILFSGAVQLSFAVVAHYFPDFRLWGLGGKAIANTGAAVWNSTQY